MRRLSHRQKLLGGALGIVAAAGTIDMLTGQPDPRPAEATSSVPPVAATITAPVAPEEIDELIRSLREVRTNRRMLPFEQIARDLFVPTARMADALAPAPPDEAISSEPVEKTEADLVQFVARHELQGVLTGRVPLALIDGVLYQLGAEIDGYRLVEIGGDSVILQQGESNVTLRVATAGDR